MVGSSISIYTLFCSAADQASATICISPVLHLYIFVICVYVRFSLYAIRLPWSKSIYLLFVNCHISGKVMDSEKLATSHRFC